MTLLAPALLLGLLGLGLPVVAHLLGREPPQVIRFAALRFLKAGDPVVTQRRRVRDRGLLAIRLLLLALLILVLARPSSLDDRQLAVLAEPHDAMIVLDASMSMDLRPDDTSELARARDVIADIVRALPDQSRVGLLTTDANGPEIAPSLAADEVMNALDEWLSDTTEHYGAKTLAACLPQAVATLESGSGRPRVIYAVGDRTARGLGSLPVAAPDDIALVPITTGTSLDEPAPSPPEHVGLVDVAWTPAPEIDPRAIRITATVHRYGGDPEQVLAVPVELNIEGNTTPAEVNVPANADADVEFTHTLLDREGATPATLRLPLRSDALPTDDVRHLWISNQDQLDIAIVNGDPSELRAHDEVFFLATALRASDQHEHLQLRSLAPDQLEQNLREHGRAAIAETDLLILANVRAPTADVAPILIDRVREGMGLWITVGDRVATREYNENLGAVLPLLLRGPVYAGTAPGRTQARTEAFASPQLAHPIFAGLGGELGLSQTQTRRLMLLEPDPERATSLALSFAGGAPALLTTSLGAGRVGLLTTTVDRDWSDLPLRPGFVPFVQRTAAYLGGLESAAAGSVLTVDQAKEFRGADSLTVIDPRGEAHRIVADNDGVLRFDATHVPGHYRVERAASRRDEVFAVQVDRSESDTSPATVQARAPEHDRASAPGTVPRGQLLFWPIALLLLAEAVWRWRRAIQ